MIFAPFAFQQQAGIVTTNLSLWYDAGNTSSYPGTGTSWFNLQPTTLTSTLTNGPTFSTNNGGTIVFDGTDDYTTGANNAILDFGTGDWSLECWVRINANSALNNSNLRSASLISTENKTGTFNGYNFVLRGDSTNTGQALIFERWINDVDTYSRYTLPAPGGVQTYLNKNQLYQLGMTHSSTGGTKFFIDGVQYNADVNLTGNVNSAAATPLEIGRLGKTGYQLYLNGAVSIVRIYNGKQLSAAEILQNYNANSNRI